MLFVVCKNWCCLFCLLSLCIFSLLINVIEKINMRRRRSKKAKTEPTKNDFSNNHKSLILLSQRVFLVFLILIAIERLSFYNLFLND